MRRSTASPSAGHMDLIADFAFRLPVTVICEMLGIPKEEHEVFHMGARTGGRLLDPVPLSRAEIDEANAGSLMQAEYFRSLFELRRRQPGEDLTSQLVQAEEEGSQALQRGADRQHYSPVRRRPRDHGQPDRQRPAGARPQPRPAAAAAERPLAHRQRHRGVPALRFLGAAHGPHGAGGCRGRRHAGGQGRIGVVPARRRQPRPAGLSRSRPARHHAAQHPPAVVRRRHPFLPRRPARAHRGRGRHMRRCCAASRSSGSMTPSMPDWRQTFVLRGLNRLPASW